MKRQPLNLYEFMERKRAVDASWFAILPFLLAFVGVLWYYHLARTPFLSLLKANMVFTGCYVLLHLVIERLGRSMGVVRLLTVLSFFIILAQITVTIHYLGGAEGFIFYPLYLGPIVASGMILHSAAYPFGFAFMSSTMLGTLLLVEDPSLGWNLVDLGLRRVVAVAIENISVTHYPVFGFELAPEAKLTAFLAYFFVSLAFAFLARSTTPLLDRLSARAVRLERDIQGTESLFNLTLFHAPMGLVTGYRNNYHPLYLNKSITDTFGIEEALTRGRDVFTLLPLDPAMADFLKRRIDNKEPVESIIASATLQGGGRGLFQIRLSFLTYPAPSGEEELFILIISNVTNELELGNIVTHAREAILLLDREGRINIYNRAAAEIFPAVGSGTQFRQVIGRTGVFPDDVAASILAGRTVDGKARIADRTYFFSSSLLKDATGIELGIHFSLKDVTNEEVFFNLSMKDPLTDVYNRRFFIETLEQELAQAVRYPKLLSLAVLDIDFFKKVNDTYGHHAGDVVLKSFSRTIGARLRKADIFARTGGEEFALYMPFIRLAGAVQLCEQIRQEVENSLVQVDGHDLRITCSLGLTEYATGDDVKQLMAKADAALYEAKRTGRNKVVVHSEALGKEASPR